MRFRIIRTSASAYAVLFVAICILFFILLGLGKEQPLKDDIVTSAKQYLGVPYCYGGATPAGFDCSGYIMFLFRQRGIDLPRTADQQATIGKSVNMSNLRPGDIVFFATDEPTISHTGLYIGDNLFIHASSSAKKVIISNLYTPYWRDAFRCARQILP